MEDDDEVISPSEEALIRAHVRAGRVQEARAYLLEVFRAAFPEDDEATVRLLATAWLLMRRVKMPGGEL